MIKVAVDLLGADKPCNELVLKINDALNECEDLAVVLYGNKSLIEQALGDYDILRVEIKDTSEAITNNDNPTRAFKQKPNSSLILAINDTKAGYTDALVSCGATGAVLVSSVLLLGRASDYRPALASVLFDSNDKPFCLCDCGANTDSKPDMLLGFAKMGIAYMQSIGYENPRVALLSNGAEEHKGNELVKECHEMFKNESFNFVGNVEGSSVMSGLADVIVCDGFAGNIVLKTIEGAAKTVFKDLVVMSKKNNSKEIMDAVKSLMYKYDYNSKGGAILLGVNKPVVKGHGAANSETIYNIIKMAYNMSKNNMTDKFKNLL